MPLLVWGDKYSVNIKEIDSQHKKLFDMVNEMHDAMRSGKGDVTVGKILSGLVEYAGSHFALEERLMSTHAYPDFIKHKQEHDALTKKAGDLMAKFKKGEAVLSFDVMDFLKNWLSNHILGTDKKYTAFLNAKGVI